MKVKIFANEMQKERKRIFNRNITFIIVVKDDKAQ